MQKIRKAVIPAAGYGTRFLPITKVVPKELLPIGRKPVIQYVVEEAVASGMEEIVLVCHRSKTAIIDYFKPDPDLKSFLRERGKKDEMAELERIESLATFKVVYQEEPLGLGHAVWCAREAVGEEPFVVMLPDVLAIGEVPASRPLMEACSGGGEWGLLLERVPKDRISSYGIIRGKKSGEGAFRIEGAVEKPMAEEAPTDLAILGRYLFPPDIFDIIASMKGGALGEIQLTDAIDRLANKVPGIGLLSQGTVFDVGTPEGWQEANRHFTLP